MKILNCMSLAKHGLPLQHPLTSKISNMVRRVPHVPGSRKIAIIHWTKAQMRTIKPLNIIKINVGGSCLVEGSSVMWNAMPMTTFCFSDLARNFHSASSTFTGFGAPSLVNLILWNRVQGWSWLMIQLAAQSDSKTLLPDDLWPSEPSAQIKDFSIWKFRRPAESRNCRKLPLLFRLFAGVHVKITPYSQKFSKNHLYWTVLVTRPYWTVVSSIQDSCSLCDAPPVRATVSTGTPAARAKRILSSNLWLSDSNLPKLIRMDDCKNTSITWDFFA